MKETLVSDYILRTLTAILKEYGKITDIDIKWTCGQAALIERENIINEILNFSDRNIEEIEQYFLNKYEFVSKYGNS